MSKDTLRVKRNVVGLLEMCFYVRLEMVKHAADLQEKSVCVGGQLTNEMIANGTRAETAPPNEEGSD